MRRLAFLIALPLLWASSAVRANGFQDFEDAELIDHVAAAVANGYGRMHGYKVAFKFLNENTRHNSALMVQYSPASRLCTFYVNPSDSSWHSFARYLEFFKGLPKKVVYEAFFAHESGHCVQLKEQIDFGPVRRVHRQELFADVFALSHVERYYPNFRKAFQASLVQMRKTEKGSEYDLAGELQKLAHSPSLLTALRVKNPQDRAFAIARAVDQL